MKFVLFSIVAVLLYLVYAKIAHVEEEPYTEAQYLAEYRAQNLQEQEKKRQEVILLSRPGCGWCTKAKELLHTKEIIFTEYNIRTSKTGQDLYKKHKGTGVPLILNGDKVIRGYNKNAISRIIN